MVLDTTGRDGVVRPPRSSGSTQRHRLYNASLALIYWAPTPATAQGRTSRAHSSLPSDITCPATDRMSAYLPRFTCFFLNCSRSRLIPSASRKGTSASHRAFKTAFGISSAGRNTPRDVRTSTIMLIGRELPLTEGNPFHYADLVGLLSVVL
jgi:hypothetical protein